MSYAIATATSRTLMGLLLLHFCLLQDTKLDQLLVQGSTISSSKTAGNSVQHVLSACPSQWALVQRRWNLQLGGDSAYQRVIKPAIEIAHEVCLSPEEHAQLQRHKQLSQVYDVNADAADHQHMLAAGACSAAQTSCVC